MGASFCWNGLVGDIARQRVRHNICGIRSMICSYWWSQGLAGRDRACCRSYEHQILLIWNRHLTLPPHTENYAVWGRVRWQMDQDELSNFRMAPTSWLSSSFSLTCDHHAEDLANSRKNRPSRVNDLFRKMNSWRRGWYSEEAREFAARDRRLMSAIWFG